MRTPLVSSVKNNRKSGVDLVRIVASILVIVVHHFSRIGFYDFKYNNGMTMIISTGLYLIALTCVPLFIMVTGYVLSEREPNRNHYLKVLYFLLEFIIISAIGMAISNIYFGKFSIQYWMKSLTAFLLEPPYYIGLYFSLYLIAPFFNKLFKALEDNTERVTFMVVLIFVFSFPSLLNTLPMVNFFDIRPTGLWAYMYYFIGVYIKYYKPKINFMLNLVLISIVSFSYGIIINFFRNGEVYSNYFGAYGGIFTVIMSLLVFLLFSSTEISSKILLTIVSKLSRYTLTFYLFSIMLSDTIAARSISLTGTLHIDLLTTLIPMVLLSITYSFPLAFLVDILMTALKRPLSVYLKLD